MIKSNKLVLFAAIVMFGSQLFSIQTASAAAPVTISNIDETSVQVTASSSAVGSANGFLTFFSSGTTTANATDLSRVQYNSVFPTAGTVSDSTLLTFVFPISMGTGKSGGVFAIAANTYLDTHSVANPTQTVPNISVSDAAYPYLTDITIATDNADPAYATEGTLVTISFTATEQIDVDNDAFVAAYSGGIPVTDSGLLENVGGFDYEFTFTMTSDDTEGEITFEIYYPDLGSRANPDEPATETTDATSVTFDMTAPVIAEVTPVAASDIDTTPDYTFTTDEAGTISYGGDCSSSTTVATSGSNTITFATLAVGVHSNCTITVADTAGNDSNTLAVTSFEITEPVSAPTPAPHPSGGGGYDPRYRVVQGVPVLIESPTIPSPTVPSLTVTVCTTHTAFLRYGDRNESVRKLQTFLTEQGIFTYYPAPTGYFGPATLQAVKNFQKKYAADILAPLGLTEPTGFVGVMTLKKINSLSCSQ